MKKQTKQTHDEHKCPDCLWNAKTWYAEGLRDGRLSALKEELMFLKLIQQEIRGAFHAGNTLLEYRINKIEQEIAKLKEKT